MCGTLDGDAPVTFIGPLPPPVHGQSIATLRIVSALAPQFSNVRIVNLSEGAGSVRRRRLAKLGATLKALRVIPGSDAVYISVNSGTGMWLTAAEAWLARTAGARIFLHHHSYAHVRRRTRRMVALARAAGPDACHIALSRTMAADLRSATPEVRRISVVGNAALVDQGLLELPLRTEGAEIVLGHLSNLCQDKGIKEVVDLAVTLHRSVGRCRLVIGGPPTDGESRRQITRAIRELDASFEYLGPITGDAKIRFFASITHFVFPSRYVHEAAPLVLYEAMAAGVVCVAPRRGAIPDQLRDSSGILVQNADSLVSEALPTLSGAAVSAAASAASRAAYLRALSESRRQLAEFTETLSARP